MSRFHTVKRGETLTSIASQYGLRRGEDIFHHPANTGFRKKRLNHKILIAGDVLFIPDPTSLGVKHTVKAGETLSLIAKKYGVPRWEDIYQHPENEGFRKKRGNPNIIFAGDIVFVPCNNPNWAGAITDVSVDKDFLDGANGLRDRFERTLKEIVSTVSPVKDVDECTKKAASQFAKAAGDRLWKLATRKAQVSGAPVGDRLGYTTHFDPLYQMRALIRSEGGLPKINEGGIASYKFSTPLQQLYLEMEQEFDRAARGMRDIAFDHDESGKSTVAPAVRIILTGFDPYGATAPTAGMWNPSGAAMLALDGWRFQSPSGRTIVVETMIFPVSFTQFEGSDDANCVQPSIVEWSLQPHLKFVRAIITVSQGGNFQIEPIAVGVQTPFGAGLVHKKAGSEVLPSFSRVPKRKPLAGTTATASQSTTNNYNALIYAEARANEIGDKLNLAKNTTTLGFIDKGGRDAVHGQLVASGLTSNDFAGIFQVSSIGKNWNYGIQLNTFKAVEKVIGMSTNSADPETTLSINVQGQQHVADVVSGPGSSFLSNQISYRVRRLLNEQGLADNIITFHVHTKHHSDYADPDDVINKLKEIILKLDEMYPP